ncbi:MAG: (Fe-S)-binding protein [Candidatus Korarchaeum sp.]|nr:(Fe-S)-binding protein [Candidatus Korarchaeum sp.]MDW8035154.1 (Fe-S)-binding protein [Candidatus Korarchaeum sp.]
MNLEVLRRLLEINARRTWNPLGVDEESCGEWAKGLGIPERGETVLYTGCLYQMAPQIKAFSGLLKRLESMGLSFLETTMKLNTFMLSSGFDVTRLIKPLTRKERERYFSVLRRIVLALRSSGVDFAYIRREPYNGVLYHDLGMDSLFEFQARRIAERLSEAGAKRVITVDPHSTYMLRYLLSEYVDRLDLEVAHYTEVLIGRDYKPGFQDGVEATIHDPCYFARWNGLIEQPRDLLEKAGVRLREPEFSREFTGCCGGPIESIFPRLSSEIARKRFEELRSTGSKQVIVSCPICMVNLERESRGSGIRVLDLAEVLL